MLMSQLPSLAHKLIMLIAPAGFWHKGQNQRSHPRYPGCVHTSTKCGNVFVMESFLDLMKLGAHGGLG